jgi:hypothetical protein
MSHALHVSDETYKAILDIAAKQGERPETLAETWLKERAAEEQGEVTPYSTEWLAGLDEAIAQAGAGQGRFVESTEDLLSIVEGQAPAPPPDEANEA